MGNQSPFTAAFFDDGGSVFDRGNPCFCHHHYRHHYPFFADYGDRVREGERTSSSTRIHDPCTPHMILRVWPFKIFLPITMGEDDPEMTPSVHNAESTVAIIGLCLLSLQLYGAALKASSHVHTDERNNDYHNVNTGSSISSHHVASQPAIRHHDTRYTLGASGS
jgi:hypothetical protein